MSSLLSPDESKRLAELRSLQILDTPAERDFDDLVALAAQICEVPSAAVSLIDADRQWFKASLGWEVKESARADAFCAQAILGKELFVVPDAAADRRFADNPLVTGGPQIRFYAGAPLITENGNALGTLCVIDRVARKLRPDQQQALTTIARNIMTLLDLRRQKNELRAAQEQLKSETAARATVEKILRLRSQSAAPVCEGTLITERCGDEEVIIYADASFEQLTGYAFEEVRGRNCRFLQGGATDPATVAVLREAIRQQQYCAVEILNYRKDGTPFWNALSISPVKDEAGTVTHFVGVQHDVTARRQAEEKLLASEKRYRSLSELIPQQVWAARPDGFINYGNQRSLEYFGQKTKNTLAGIEWQKVLHPDDVERTLERWSQAVKSATRYENENRLRRHDGEYRWHLSQAVALRDEDGQIIKWYGTNTDIHERKEAEAAFRRAESYRNLFQHANDAILIFDPVSEIIFDASDKAFEIYGRKREDFVGHSLKEMSQNVSRGTEELEKLLHDGVYKEFESVHLRGDGTPLNLVINAAVIDYQGQKAVLTINRDVSARKKIEDALREREEHFRLLVEGVEDYAIFMLDPGGYIISWNAGAERLKGLTAEEAIGRHFSCFYTAEDQAVNHPEEELLIATQVGRYQEEGWRVHKDGSRFLANVLITALRDESGQLRGFSKITQDITARKTNEIELQESRARYRQLFDSNPHPVWVYDLASLEFLAVNEEAVRRYGYSAEEFSGLTIKDLRPPEDVPILLAHVAEVRARDIPVTRLCRHRKKDGRIIDVEVSSQPITFGNRRARLVLTTDITLRKQAEEQLLHNALHDALTGLPNRALFLEHLRRAIERNRTRWQKTFAVLFLDFDHFKVINDSLGHMEGDNLLRLIAQRLINCLRPGDIVARLGGDEFTILLEDLNQFSEAVQIVERIQTSLKKTFDLRGNEVSTSASIGIVSSGTDYTDPETMLRDADIAMYSAKAGGKARYEIFNQTMHERASSRLKLEIELRQAVEREEFTVYYQPIINLQTGQIKGFEALVRWAHATRGIVSPLEFIPVAEETGLIIPLGLWILRQSCRQLRFWQNEDLSLSVSVNISCKQFKQPDLVERIVEIIRETQIEEGSLRLEITESHLMEDTEAAVSILKRLRAHNIKLSMDDFGTGYSSLSYLHRLPLDYLKIDRSFVSRMQVNSENREIVRTIILLAKNLKLEVIAEGIETAEQADFLKTLDCDYGQGYLYSRPVDTQQASALIVQNYNAPGNSNVMEKAEERIILNTEIMQ